MSTLSSARAKTLKDKHLEIEAQEEIKKAKELANTEVKVELEINEKKV